MKEVYKQIKDFPNYSVSNLGNVRNDKTGRVLRALNTGNGYLKFSLYTYRKVHGLYAHRLVAEAFCEKPEGCDVVNHIDGVKTNNHSDNLEWTTASGNAKHAYENGLNRSPRGKNQWRSNLAEETVRKIKERISKGISVKDIAEELLVSKDAVYGIKSGRTWGWLK